VLVLGCTHYPLLRALFEAAVPEGVRVIDSAQAAAESAVQTINGQLSANAAATPVAPAQIRCFATDSVEKFERLGSRFLGQPVSQVQLVDLGG
jgi:glutamate racemase